VVNSFAGVDPRKGGDGSISTPQKKGEGCGARYYYWLEKEGRKKGEQGISSNDAGGNFYGEVGEPSYPMS